MYDIENMVLIFAHNFDFWLFFMLRRFKEIMYPV